MRCPDILRQHDQVMLAKLQIAYGLGIKPSECQQLLHQSRRAPRGKTQFADDDARLFDVGCLCSAGQTELQSGERCAQLVCGSGRKLPLSSQHLSDAGEQVIQRRREGKQFVRHVLVSDRL